MGKLTVFNFVTLNGFFQGPDGDTSWAHERPSNDYASGATKGESTLLFGRVTYEMMASFWPTPAAAKMSPEVADKMNRSEKVVFSRSLRAVDWAGTRISATLGEEIRDPERTLPKAMAFGTLLVAGLYAVNYAGLRASARLYVVVAVVAVAPLAAILAGAVADPDELDFGALGPLTVPGGLLSAAGIALVLKWAFVAVWSSYGAEIASTVVAEMADRVADQGLLVNTGHVLLEADGDGWRGKVVNVSSASGGSDGLEICDPDGKSCRSIAGEQPVPAGSVLVTNERTRAHVEMADGTQVQLYKDGEALHAAYPGTACPCARDATICLRQPP